MSLTLMHDHNAVGKITLAYHAEWIQTIAELTKLGMGFIAYADYSDNAPEEVTWYYIELTGAY
jgi:hypothetical protein